MTTYQWSDRIDELTQVRSFVVSVMFESLDNQSRYDEFAAKLAAIDEELNQLLS